MRGEVLAELDHRDVSTETARRAAAESIRGSFAAKYGSEVIRHRPNLDVPFAAFGAVVIVALVGVRAIRSRRRRGGERERDDVDA
jgi:hypothetical protein